MLSLHLPVGLAFPLQALALVMFLLLALPTLGTLVARAGWRPMVAPLTLVATQTLWFVVPIALTWTGAVSLVADALQLRHPRGDALGAVPVDHAALRPAGRRPGAQEKADLGAARATG